MARPELSAIVRETRLRAGLSQRELAEQAGVSEATVWNIENGRYRRPQKLKIYKISEVLGLDPHALLLAPLQKKRAS